MDQWEILFSHADQLGLFLHFKMMEAENQGLLDNGGVGSNSKLYYRELIARFGHHLALNWNLCEENGEWGKYQHTPPQFTTERHAMANYMADNDPYGHHIVSQRNQLSEWVGAMKSGSKNAWEDSKQGFISTYNKAASSLQKGIEAIKINKN
mgnify:CR=1 FL=1